MRNCNLQFRSTHGVQIVFFVIFHMFYVCLSGTKISMSFSSSFASSLSSCLDKTLGKDGSAVLS